MTALSLSPWPLPRNPVATLGAAMASRNRVWRRIRFPRRRMWAATAQAAAQLKRLAWVWNPGDLGHCARGHSWSCRYQQSDFQCITKFMTNCQLFKTPSHKPANMTFIFGSCTARNIIANNWMKRYVVTSAQCFLPANAWLGAECAQGKIMFGWNFTEHMMRPITQKQNQRNLQTSILQLSVRQWSLLSANQRQKYTAICSPD